MQEAIDLPFQRRDSRGHHSDVEGTESVAKIVRAMKDFSHPGSGRKATHQSQPGCRKYIAGFQERLEVPLRDGSLSSIPACRWFPACLAI